MVHGIFSGNKIQKQKFPSIYIKRNYTLRGIQSQGQSRIGKAGKAGEIGNVYAQYSIAQT
jgi:hypothetical protein